MDGRGSKGNNLMGGDRDYEIDPVYSVKKASVMYLLGKILYGVVIFVLFGYGAYFLFMSSQDYLSKDINDFNLRSEDWNRTYLHDVKEWKVSIANEKGVTMQLTQDKKKMHEYDDSDRIYYDSFQYVLGSLNPMIRDVELRKRRTDDNVTIYS
jgi:hypothetical protein